MLRSLGDTRFAHIPVIVQVHVVSACKYVVWKHEIGVAAAVRCDGKRDRLACETAGLSGSAVFATMKSSV